MSSNNVKKIIFLEIVQSYGGARKSTIELAKRLSLQHDVSIIDINGCCKPFVNECKNSGINLSIIDPRDRLFIISSRSLFKRILNLIRFFFYRIKINRRLLKIIGSEDCFIIVNNTKVLSFLFHKPKRSKCVYFARGWFISQQISRTDRFLLKKLVDRYVGVSEATRYAIYCNKLSRLNDIYVVHNAIDKNDFKSVGPAKEKKANLNILFSGGFLPSKGQEVAISIAKELKRQGADFKIVLCGIVYESKKSMNWLNYIESCIVEEGLQNNVELVINSHNVVEYFYWCDIFCHPSDTEGLPRVIMEAMILRKPVIANAVGGVTDYILNNFTGILTRHNNIEDYIEAIKKLQTDKYFRDSIVENAFNLVSKTFTIEQQLREMDKLLY